MPVTQASLTSDSNAVDAASFATASIAPTADNLILVAVANDAATEAGAVEPTLSGNGLTWVSIGTAKAVTTARITLFRSMGAAPSAGAITIDFASNTQNACCWSVIEFGNVNTGGTNGSAAVVQSATNTAAFPALTVVVTLAAFASANNATYGAFGTTAGTAIEPGSGFTEVHDVAAGGSHLSTEWRVDNDTTVDETHATGANWHAIGVEIGVVVSASSGKLRTRLRGVRSRFSLRKWP